jgi:hypothetical protein
MAGHGVRKTGGEMTDNEFKFVTPPVANTKLSFGKGSNMHIEFYSKKKPNALQRWLLKKMFGIYLEDL